MNSDVTIQEAWAALWPILTAVGGGYVALLGIIYKLLTDQIARLQAQNDKLTDAVQGFTTTDAASVETARDMNRTLEQLLDGILPRAPRGGD